MNRPTRMFAAMARNTWLTRAVVAIAMFSLAFVAQPALSALVDAVSNERVVKIVAERFEYSPDTVVLKKGEPVILHLVSRDRLHGFNVKALGVRADVMPGEEVRIRVVPDKVGSFPFKCDLFCGSGHTDMGGVIVVTD